MVVVTQFGPSKFGGRFRPGDGETNVGALITKLRPIDGRPGPLESAGVLPGMVVVQIDGVRVVENVFEDILKRMIAASKKNSEYVFGFPNELGEDGKNTSAGRTSEGDRSKKPIRTTSSRYILAMCASCGESLSFEEHRTVRSGYAALCGRCSTTAPHPRTSPVPATTETVVTTATNEKPVEHSRPDDSLVTPMDDLDELEALLSSACRDTASLAVAVDRHIVSKDIEAANAIDSHIEQLLVDI